MEDQICPRCKTSKFGNPTMKLLVNVCGHPLCESCVDILFARGSAQCLECGSALRRGNFRAQLYEDPYVEKELDIRRKVLRDFNKQRSDFSSLREYNDYLEEVENIIFNLANDVDVEATRKKVDDYKRQNKEVISRNRSRLSDEDRELLELIEHEKEQFESKKKEITEYETKNKQMKAKLKEELLKAFASSDKSTDEILAKVQALKKAEPEPTPVEKKFTPPPAVRKGEVKLSTGLTAGISSIAVQRDHSAPVLPPVETFPLFTYKPPEIDWCGPNPPDKISRSDPNFSRLAVFDAQVLAGGFTPEVSTLRAVQESVSGLFFFAPKGRKPPLLADETL